MGPRLPGLTKAAQESCKNMGMLAGVDDWGGVGNGDAQENSHWDLNPGMAAMCIGTARFCWNHAVWGLPLPHGLRSRKDNARPGRERRA